MALGKIVKYIKFEAKTASQLEQLINDQAQGLTPLSIYFSSGRHYAWFSAPQGARRSSVKTKTITTEHKKEKVSL